MKRGGLSLKIGAFDGALDFAGAAEPSPDLSRGRTGEGSDDERMTLLLSRPEDLSPTLQDISFDQFWDHRGDRNLDVPALAED
jgi:hypothetical protein